MFRRGYGGPQADCFDERELFTYCQLKEEFIKLKQVSQIKRELKEICPQADDGGERELSQIKRELKEIGPQADDGGEQQLFAHCLLIAELIKLRKFFTHCLLIAELIKLRKFFAHC